MFTAKYTDIFNADIDNAANIAHALRDAVIDELLFNLETGYTAPQIASVLILANYIAYGDEADAVNYMHSLHDEVQCLICEIVSDAGIALPDAYFANFI
jgi:hypothetical protein